MLETFLGRPFEMERTAGSQQFYSDSTPTYLFSYSFWEAHLGSCGLACVSLRLHLSVILFVASDSQMLQSKHTETVRE